MEPTGTIATLHQFIDAIETSSHAMNNSRLWWRGEPQIGGWRLQPKMFRKVCHPLAEAHVLSAFMKGAGARYGSCPLHNDHAGWMFLAQHHGAPTRLLDWTESPLVAAFFAVATDIDAPGRIWALCPFAMNGRVVGEAVVFQPNRSPAKELVAAAINPTRSLKEGEPTAAAIVANENNQRMLMQLGAFTIHGTPKPLDDHSDSGTFLRCYDVPAAAKKALAAQLSRAGIRRSSLFPDLDSLSAELAALHVDGWPTVGEVPSLDGAIGGSVVIDK